MQAANSIAALAYQIVKLADAVQPPATRRFPTLDPRYPLQGRGRTVARRAMREQLRQRDGDRCCYCQEPMVFPAKGQGERSNPRMASIEHVVNVRDGGTDDPGNLKLACLACNHGRNEQEQQCAHEDAREGAMHRLLRAYRRGQACKLTPEMVAVVAGEIFELEPRHDAS